MAWLSEEDFEFENDGELEFWNPEEEGVQKIIEGTVLKVKKGKFEKLFLVIETEDGVFATTQCARLDYQIKKMKIEEDDYVQVEYKGRRNDEYQSHDYVLRVDDGTDDSE